MTSLPKNIKEQLLEGASGADRARLRAVSQPESGAWLHALPSPHLGTLLDDDSLRVAVALRLGCKVCEPHICTCGSSVEANGHHALSCRRCTGRFPRHHALNDIVRRAFVSANVPCVLEPPGLCRSDGKRPDGLTLVPWKNGRCLIWDATCVSTVAPSHLGRTVHSPAAAAEDAADKKRLKYAALETHYFFVPFAVETMGCWGAEAKKLDKLLNKLEENEPELASSPEEECVICVNAKATMQTSPCGHRVVCRRCFVKTIQMAVSQRLLPLRCVICRAKILRLRQAPRLVTSKSWQVSSSSGKSWGVPGSVSSYSVGARSVPASASLYSVTSGESSLSGVSSVSSNSGGNVPSSCSTKLCGGAKCGGACLGAVPRSAPSSLPPKPRQPASNSLRRSQHHSMKARLQEYQVMSYTGGPVAGESSGRLPPIREFQREFREGRRESTTATASASTRIRCAQKIVTQLETSPQKNTQHFFRPLKPPSKDDPPKSRDHSKETERKNDNPKIKPKRDDKKKKEEDNKPEDKNKKDESNDNRKNEIAEKKKEEKLRLKAEKEAKREAKLQAKEEERQAKLLAKEEERQAKLLAKEEKKKAKKEAKLAAQAEKEKNK